MGGFGSASVLPRRREEVEMIVEMRILNLIPVFYLVWLAVLDGSMPTYIL